MKRITPLVLAGILVLMAGCTQSDIVTLTIRSKSVSPQGVYTFTDTENQTYQIGWLDWQQLETGRTYKFFEAGGQMNLYNRCAGNTDCLNYWNQNVSPPTTSGP